MNCSCFRMMIYPYLGDHVIYWKLEYNKRYPQHLSSVLADRGAPKLNFSGSSLCTLINPIQEGICLHYPTLCSKKNPCSLGVSMRDLTCISSTLPPDLIYSIKGVTHPLLFDFSFGLFLLIVWFAFILRSSCSSVLFLKNVGTVFKNGQEGESKNVTMGHKL